METGASVTCLGFSIWWRYRAQWGPLKPFEGTEHGAHGKPLQIAGKTQHLDLQWGEALGQACFIVIVGLESPLCLIGMDIMRPLRIRIEVTNGTATPAQPNPQTVHLNVAQQQQQRMKKPLQETVPPAIPTVETSPPGHQQQQRMKMPLPGIIPPAIPTVETSPPAAPPAASPAAPLAATPAPASLPVAPPSTAPHTASRALLLQTADIPPETAHLVRCHNPWPAEDVLFCPEDALRRL